jgi:hypothetical protein
MAINSDDAQVYIDLIVDLFFPLIGAAENPDAAARLLADLGYFVPSTVTAFSALSPALDKLPVLLDALEQAVEGGDDDQLLEALLEILRLAAEVYQAVNTFDAAVQANFAGSGLLTDTDILTVIVRKLADYLVMRYFEDEHPIVHAALLLAGIFQIEEIAAGPTDFQAQYLRRTVHWENISAFFSDSVGALRGSLVDAQGLRYQPLIYFIYRLAAGIGFYSTFVKPDNNALTAFNDGRDLSGQIPPPDSSPLFDDAVLTPFTDINLLTSLNFPLTFDPAAALGLLFYPVLDPVTQHCSGVGAGLRFGGDLQIPLSDNYQLSVNFSATLNDSLGVRLDSGGQFTFIDKVLTGSPQALLDSVQFGAQVSIVPTSTPTDAPLLSLGSPQGSRFQIGSGALAIGIDRTSDLSLSVEVDLKDGLIVLDTDDSDGFLAQILPADGINAQFALGVGFSNRAGFYFKGSSGLVIRLPLHVDLGPVGLDDLTVGLTFENGQFPLVISAGISADLGPLQAAVDEVGVRAVFEFKADRSGNLGPVQVSFGFKPPNGVGLALDAGVVQGGGYLYIDTDRGQYAGALELVVADWLTLTAIGLITTKMPDGSEGFSLLVIVTADFGTGIQLGFGFTLIGVGGLLGLNRTMLFQPLMDGVRTGAINGILFPTDIIANAPKIISDLQTIFPPQNNTFLIGPMAKLGWGSPALITGSLGVIIEIPPGDVAILGVIQLALPTDDDVVLLLQVNFAGALEFDKQRLYFFASLYDSRILFITITGDMGLLIAYGADANFVLTVGGFHPQFNPPPLPFPAPQRVQLDIINESYARIRCDGYFAVTSNTAQFGSQSEYFFGYSSVSVTGHSGFDALFQFSPFHFTVEISTAFAANVFGVGVFSIDVDLTLEGPTPWHAHGTASISMFLFSIGIGIDLTWGDSRDTLLPALAVMPILLAEFSKPANWRAMLPPNANLLVTLRKLDPTDDTLVLHPLGTLRVSQRAVPLNLLIDKVGNQPPSDADRFQLDVTFTGLSKTRNLTEAFAPAQFKNFSDADKLSQAAYAPQDSGIELAGAGAGYATGTAITRNVRYDLTIIDTGYRRVARRFFIYINSLFVHFMNGGSIARNPLSAVTLSQMQPFAQKIAVSSESFAVANLADNTAYALGSVGFSSQASAQDYLNRAVAANPSLTSKLHVLGQYEVAA